MRASFRFIKGNIRVFLLTNSVWFFAMRMANPYLSLYVIALGGSMVEIGFVTVFMSLASLFIYPLAGQVTDKMGRVKLISVSRSLSALMFIFYIFAPNWVVLAAGSFLQGLFIFHFPATSALIADSLSPEQRGIGYATLMAIPQGVSILAPYVGAWVITEYTEVLGIKYLYAINLICGMLVSIIYLKFLRETLKSATSIRFQDLPTLIKESYQGVLEVLRWLPQSLKALTLIMSISVFFNWLAAPFWIVYGVEQIGLTTIEWGLLILFFSGLRVVLQIPAGMLVDRFGRRKALITALAFSILPIFLFVYCKTFLQTLVVLLMITVANSFLMPACTSLLANIVPREKRGRVMAALGRGLLMIPAQGVGGGGPGIGLLLAVPLMLGSLVSGYVYSFNPVYPWYLLTSALGLCLTLTFILVKEPDEPEL